MLCVFQSEIKWKFETYEKEPSKEENGARLKLKRVTERGSEKMIINEKRYCLEGFFFYVM